MIQNCATFTQSDLYLEFVLCRTAVGRGGEHLYLRWDEAHYDYFYETVDFDWTLLK